MTLVIPEGFASVIHSLRWSGDPEPMAVTYGVGVTPGSTAADVAALATEVATVFKTNMQARLNDDLELVSTEVKFQYDALPTPPAIGVDTSQAFTGTESASTLLPQNCAFLVHKRAIIGGRGGRGRMYFPGVPEAASDNLGNLGGATLTAWNGSLSDWQADLLAGTLIDPAFGMVILHSDPGAFSAVAPFAVATLSLDPVIATQRRRLRR